MFHYCSKNHQRALDTIQISLEAEARGRLEALRQRKKLEQDVLELEAALEATVRARADVEKNYKRFQQQIRDLELVIEEEQSATQVGLFDVVVVVYRVGQKKRGHSVLQKYCSDLHDLMTVIINDLMYSSSSS